MPAKKTRPTYSDDLKSAVLRMVEDVGTTVTRQKITEWTGVSTRTQDRIRKCYCEHKQVSSPKQNRKGANNPNAKIPHGFETILQGNIEKNPSHVDHERAEALSKITGRKISEKMIKYWRHKFRITRKIAKVLFTERYTLEHLKQKQEFLATMHPYHGKVKMVECMSTDESGFYLNATRKYAYARASCMRRKIIGSKKLAGGSYLNESSRAYVIMPKSKMSKLNLMLSISLNPAFPVVSYEIQKAYWNQEHFTYYVNNRQSPNSTQYDLIDRASFHKITQGKNDHRFMTVSEAYMNNGIDPVYIPTGYPEMNPVEQAFNYLKKYVHTSYVRKQLTGGWKEAELRSEIEKGIATITHKMVKSWFRGSYVFMYPRLRVPKELQ